MRILLFCVLAVVALSGGYFAADLVIGSKVEKRASVETGDTAGQADLGRVLLDSLEHSASEEVEAYVPQTPGRARVELHSVVHMADIMPTEEFAKGPPDMPMEDYAKLHLRGFVETSECALMQEKLAATCMIQDFAMESMGKGLFMVKAEFWFDPKADPQTPTFQASLDQNGRSFETFKDLYIRGTYEELRKIRRHSYAYGVDQCAAYEGQVEACHVDKVVMNFIPKTDKLPAVNAKAHVELKWGREIPQQN